VSQEESQKFLLAPPKAGPKVAPKSHATGLSVVHIPNSSLEAVMKEVNKMEKLRELDFDVIEAIQSASGQRLYFADVASISEDATKLHKILEKLIARNYITKGNDINGVYYTITESNTPMNIRKVICPICKTARRTNRLNQLAAYCRNPECKTSTGRRRVFWLVNIDHWNRGEVRRINQAH
jgi:hypothetical protein